MGCMFQISQPLLYNGNGIKLLIIKFSEALLFGYLINFRACKTLCLIALFFIILNEGVMRKLLELTINPCSKQSVQTND